MRYALQQVYIAHRKRPAISQLID